MGVGVGRRGGMVGRGEVRKGEEKEGEPKQTIVRGLVVRVPQRDLFGFLYHAAAHDVAPAVTAQHEA